MVEVTDDTGLVLDSDRDASIFLLLHVTIVMYVLGLSHQPNQSIGPKTTRASILLFPPTLVKF